jgi:hypothetical protein
MVTLQSKPLKLTTNNAVNTQSNINNIDRWHPSRYFKASLEEIHYVYEITQKITWKKETFHEYFKSIEKLLLENFRDIINMCYANNTTIPCEWIDNTNQQWRMLALIRDFHDHTCGRDRKHYIRTDDCRRFLSCVIRGLSLTSFSKPVHRLLCGENAPRKFIHPQFVKFNSIRSY